MLSNSTLVPRCTMSPSPAAVVVGLQVNKGSGLAALQVIAACCWFACITVLFKVGGRSARACLGVRVIRVLVVPLHAGSLGPEGQWCTPACSGCTFTRVVLAFETGNGMSAVDSHCVFIVGGRAPGIACVAQRVWEFTWDLKRVLQQVRAPVGLLSPECGVVTADDAAEGHLRHILTPSTCIVLV